MRVLRIQSLTTSLRSVIRDQRTRNQTHFLRVVILSEARLLRSERFYGAKDLNCYCGGIDAAH